jgi:Zn-dependent protease with chaperone function
MNFFEQQDQARRRTKTLIVLFVLAVIAIVIAVNAAMTLIWIWKSGNVRFSSAISYPAGFFATNTLVTLGLIIGGTLIETFNLRDGGDAVARMAGGRLVFPSSQELRERQLLNVVEEMSLASGIACPKVYVLDREESINAFAAGYNPNEAVIAVTRGTLDRLTRDELQGVVAHEFSHILNGDMRMNVRLIGVLFGIQMIAGFGMQLMNFGRYFGITRSRDRDDKGQSAQLVLLAIGFALFVIGYIGVFFARMIKSAVSRQREFLADASAVQFTRNPDGIGKALRKIGGLSRDDATAARIQHPNAELLSHLFLSAVKPSLMDGLFATHPPVEERLHRIYGRNIGLLDAPAIPVDNASEPRLPDIPYIAAGFADTATASVSTPAALSATAAPPISIMFGHHADEQTALAPQLDSAVREPHAACAVVYALLLGKGAERETQLTLLKRVMLDQYTLVPYLADTITQMPKSVRLPLLDLAMPALRQLSQTKRDVLLSNVNQLIAADQRITLAEFVVQTVLMRRLHAYASRATPVSFEYLQQLQPECAMVLSLVAHVVAASTGTSAHDAFMRGSKRLSELSLPLANLTEVPNIEFVQVRNALDRLNQLAPLAKPALIKGLLAVAGDAQPLPVDVADLLRAICAAVDSPIPPAVASTYTAHYWITG